MISFPTDLVPQLEKELRQGFQMNRVNAEIQAKQNIRINRIKHKSIEGLGQLKCRIPPDAYHFWGQKLGYDCWNDDQFMDEFLRDNSDCKVVSGGVKEISVGWIPSTSPRSRTVYK